MVDFGVAVIWTLFLAMVGGGGGRIAARPARKPRSVSGAEEANDTLRQPVEVTGRTTADEAHVTAIGWLFEDDCSRHVLASRQRGRGQKRVVARVEDERSDRDGRKPRFAACACPVIVGIAKAVERGGDDVIERA